MDYTDEDLKLIMMKAQERIIKFHEDELNDLIKEDYRKSVQALVDQCDLSVAIAERLINKLDEEYGIKYKEYLEFNRKSDLPYSIIYDVNTCTIERKTHRKCLLCGSVNHLLRLCGSLIK